MRAVVPAWGFSPGIDRMGWGPDGVGGGLVARVLVIYYLAKRCGARRSGPLGVVHAPSI